MEEVRYQIWLLSTEGERFSVFSGTKGYGDVASIDITLLLSDVGPFYATFNVTTVESADYGDLLLEAVVDQQIVVAANDPYVDDDWTEVYRGFWRGVGYDFDEDGRETLIASGRHINDLLASESIRYPHGNTGACKSGPCESVAKRYVFQNIGAGAEPAERVREGVQVEPDGAMGRHWEGCRGDRNLLEVVQELADAAPADFMMVPTGDASFRFEWREEWGTDRRLGNVEGNAPVVFSPKQNNVQRISYREDYQNEANVVYLLGAGAGSERHVLTLQTDGSERSKWSRRAISRDARTVADDIELQAVGVSELIANRPTKDLSFVAMQSPGVRWRRDWDLGDLVTCEHHGKQFDQQIVGVHLTVASDGTANVQAITAEIVSEIEVTTTSTSTTTTTSSSTSTTTSTTTSMTLTSTSTSKTTSNTQSYSQSLTKSDTTTTSTTSLSTSVTTVSFSKSLSRSYSTSTTISTSTTSTSLSTSTSTTTLAPLE